MVGGKIKNFIDGIRPLEAVYWGHIKRSYLGYDLGMEYSAFDTIFIERKRPMNLGIYSWNEYFYEGLVTVTASLSLWTSFYIISLRVLWHNLPDFNIAE